MFVLQVITRTASCIMNYVGSDGLVTRNRSEAMKFETKEAAEDYKNSYIATTRNFVKLKVLECD